MVTPSSRSRLRLYLDRHALCYLVLLLFTVGLVWPFFKGRVLYWGDILLYFDPMQRFAQNRLVSGRLPLWNPYMLCGQPYLGNPQMGLLYPLSVLTPFLPAPLYFSMAILIHLAFCGVWMYHFLLRWTLHRTSALIGGMVYMGSACLISRLQFPPMIETAAYCPLILMLIDANIDRSTWTNMAMLAAAIGLALLAAHPQMAYLIFLLAIGYSLWRIARRFQKQYGADRSNVRTGFQGKSRLSAGRILIGLFGAAGLGVALAACQWFPMLELIRAGTRERMTPALANRFVFDLSHLITLIIPDFFGHPSHADYWGGGNAWEPSLFIGWAPLVCIGVSIVSRYRSSSVRFWAGSALLSLWLATGTAGGLYWLAFYAVPGLSNFHDPARFLFITTVAMCTLCAIGCDTLFENSSLRTRSSTVGILIATALPLWWFAGEWNPTTPYRVLEAGTAPMTIRGSGRSYLPDHDLYWRRFVTEAYGDYGGSHYLEQVLRSRLPNLEMRAAHESASGYEPVPIAAPAELDGLARIALHRNEPNLVNLLALMNVDKLLLSDYERLYDGDLLEMYPGTSKHSAEIRIYSPRQNLNRVWLVHEAIHVEGMTRIQAALTAPGFDPSKTAILSGMTRSQALSALAWGSEVPLHDGRDQVSMHRVSDIEMVMDCDAGSTPGLLICSSACFPGWKATVDGKPVELMCADGGLLGLEIPSGSHHVRLLYHPMAVRIGFFVSMVALGILIGISAARLTLRFTGPAGRRL